MKSILRFFFLTAILVSLCACGNSEPDLPIEATTATEGIISDNPVVPDSGKTEDTQNEESVATEPALTIGYFVSINDISDMQADGSYLVCGTDKQNSLCYGLWHADGVLELLEDYEVYFPLADSHFLVSTDADVNRALRHGTCLNDGISSGKIIDRSGSILFEANTNQRLHIINSKSVMVVEATSGFDAKTVKWGVIDHNGNWTHELGDGDILADFLSNKVKLNGDGTWKYSRPFVSASPSYDGKESDSLFFVSSSSNVEYTIIYRSESDTLIEIDQPSLNWNIQQVNDAEWLQQSGGHNGSWSNKFYTLYNANGEKTQYLSGYYTTINGVKYWITERLLTKQLVICSDKNAEGYTYSEDDSQRIKTVAGFLEDQVCLVMRGADGLMYFTIHDMNGNTVVEPILLEEYKSGRAVMVDEQFVCYNSSTMTLCLLDPLTGEKASTCLGIDEYPDIWSLGNELFAVQFEIDGTNIIYIFSKSGDRII